MIKSQSAPPPLHYLPLSPNTPPKILTLLIYACNYPLAYIYLLSPFTLSSFIVTIRGTSKKQLIISYISLLAPACFSIVASTFRRVIYARHSFNFIAVTRNLSFFLFFSFSFSFLLFRSFIVVSFYEWAFVNGNGSRATKYSILNIFFVYFLLGVRIVSPMNTETIKEI